MVMDACLFQAARRRQQVMPDPKASSQALSLDIGVQNEQDAAQGLTVGHSRPSLHQLRR